MMRALFWNERDEVFSIDYSYWQGSHTTVLAMHFLHSLHVERLLSCMQMEPPPHSLQWERCLSCTQMEPPPHSLHVERILSCTQMELPPHSLHVERILL